MVFKQISLPHTCPHCGVVAFTEEEIEKIFGTRIMKYESGKKIEREQSWCKKCRSHS
ncbi:hypothetical protein [Helicobacter cetorum]|uniref:hypothetical protein n=1 Tax=Helicobacter cetorum TaxID=138563 RepID=UPI001315632B|nr:hypothetical protein [Helicobacter cetorum]